MCYFDSFDYSTVSSVWNLPFSFFTHIHNSQAEKRFDVKRILFQKFPDELEGIEVIFGIGDYFRQDKELDKKRKRYPRQSWKHLICELTEFQFLFVHFILENFENNDFMLPFWKVLSCFEISGEGYSTLSSLRFGLLAQVALYCLFEENNRKTVLSHPKEDAFDGIDFWCGFYAIQIKHTENSTCIFTKNRSVYFTKINPGRSKLVAKKNIFFQKGSIYQKKLCTEPKKLFIAVSVKDINLNTGRLSSQSASFFRTEMRKIFLQND